MSASRKEKPIAVHFGFHDEQAKTVCIAGSFNDWNPTITPMLTTAPGQWSKELYLSPGIHEYQYVVDGKWFNDPQAVKSAPSPFGGRNSVLVVEPHTSKSSRVAKRVGAKRNRPGWNTSLRRRRKSHT